MAIQSDPIPSTCLDTQRGLAFDVSYEKKPYWTSDSGLVSFFLSFSLFFSRCPLLSHFIVIFTALVGQVGCMKKKKKKKACGVFDV